MLGCGVAPKIPAMKFLDPDTGNAVRVFLARLPADVRLEYAILYGSRARGEDGSRRRFSPPQSILKCPIWKFLKINQMMELPIKVLPGMGMTASQIVSTWRGLFRPDSSSHRPSLETPAVGCQ